MTEDRATVAMPSLMPSEHAAPQIVAWLNGEEELHRNDVITLLSRIEDPQERTWFTSKAADWMGEPPGQLQIEVADARGEYGTSTASMLKLHPLRWALLGIGIVTAIFAFLPLYRLMKFYRWGTETPDGVMLAGAAFLAGLSVFFQRREQPTDLLVVFLVLGAAAVGAFISMFLAAQAFTFGGALGYGMIGYLIGLVLMVVFTGIAYFLHKRDEGASVGSAAVKGGGLLALGLALMAFTGGGIFALQYHTPAPALDEALTLGVPDVFWPGVGTREEIAAWMGDELGDRNEDDDGYWNLKTERFREPVYSVSIYFDEDEPDQVHEMQLDFLGDDKLDAACEEVKEELDEYPESEHGCGSKNMKEGGWYLCAATPDLERNVSVTCDKMLGHIEYVVIN